MYNITELEIACLPGSLDYFADPSMKLLLHIPELCVEILKKAQKSW